MTHSIIISPDGTLHFVYDDRLASLAQFGDMEIRRASSVEPAAGGGWEADMRPLAGPDGPVLGPFPLRGQALAAEVEWVERRLAGMENV